MQLDGYIRVSQVRGRAGDSFISPDVQRSQIERWAELRGATIAEWHVDLDESGAKQDRPGLTAALERIETGQTEGLVVAKLDRFARSISGALETIHRIDAAGAKFVSVSEGIDPTTPAGKLQQNLMLILAEFELDRIREGWDTARGRAVARGVHIASKTPTGYLRGTDGRLIPNPEYAPVIAELFERRISGDPWGELAQFLQDSGIRSPYGNKHWTAAVISQIISNRVYLGEARSGQFVNAEAHEPLVARAVWEAAQGVRTMSKQRSKEGSLLAGLLRCAGCRYMMKPDTMPGRDGSRLRIYRCRGNHAAGKCPDRSAVMGRVIEPLVEARFLAEAAGISAYSGGLDELAAAELALDAAEDELRTFRDDDRISIALGTEMYVEGLQARMATVDKAACHLGELYRDSSTKESFVHADLVSMWPDFTIREKQKLMGAQWDAIMIRSGRRLPIEDRVWFLEHGEAPTDLPTRGRRFELSSWPWPETPPPAGLAGVQDLQPGQAD